MKARLGHHAVNIDPRRVRGDAAALGVSSAVMVEPTSLEVGNPAPTPTLDDATVRFTVPGAPMGKPRMTRRDKWKQRPCVVHYRAWCDAARQAAGYDTKQTFLHPIELRIQIYLPIPQSWRGALRAMAIGAPHRQKPDGDNLIKAVMDALLTNDQIVVVGEWRKFWDDGSGPRTEVEITWHSPA